MITKADVDKYLNEEDYYTILGVEKQATMSEIEKAFRKLSLKWHPDKQKFKDESLRENSTIIYKKLNEAKEVLCNDDKRQIYDKFGLEGLKNNGPEMNPEHNNEMMNDFMKQMFGKQMSKKSNVPDIKIIEEVSLEDLYTGKQYKKELDRYSLCKECKGYGTEDGFEHKCTDCGGSGVQIKVIRSGNMIQQMQQMCTLCHGGGSDPKIARCNICHGKKLVKEKKEINIVIPKGAFEGVTVCIRGEGNEIPHEDRENSTTRSNIAINIKEKKHSIFKRGFKIPKYKENTNPKDLKIKLEISLVESLTGFSKKIKFLDDREINISHDKIIKNGDVMVIPNYGMPVLNNTGNNNEHDHGHLYVVFDVEYPDDLNATTKRRLWQLLTNTPYKEITDLPNKVTLESAEKYKVEDFKDKHDQKPQFPGGFPFMGGFPAQFAQMGNMQNNNDSDTSDNDNSGDNTGEYAGENQQKCGVQ